MELDREALVELTDFSVLKEFKENPKALALFGQILEKKRFEMRATIISEETNLAEMFFLLSGKVSINKKAPNGEIHPLAQLDSKSHPFFGESAILGIPVTSANVTAASMCTCFSLRREDFELFSKEEPFLAMSFYKNLATGLFHRIQKSNQDLFIIGTHG